MNLAIRILRARKEKRISQKETAWFMGISRSALAQWETAACYPSLKNLLKLSEVLNVSFEWLATGRGDKKRLIELDDNMQEISLEKKIIQCLKSLPESKKRIILNVITNMM